MNKFVSFILLISVTQSLAGCSDPRSTEEIRELYDGIFLLVKGNGEPENSLHYIIFYQDSTYVHKYIIDSDTLVNKGKWKITKKVSYGHTFCLYDWIPYGRDPYLRFEKKRKNSYPSILLHKNDDYAGLQFDIDGGYDFKKISKQNADRLGIREDSVTWHRIQEYDWEWAIRNAEEKEKNKGIKRK